MNYNRLGINHQLGIASDKTDTSLLEALNKQLLSKVNSARKSIYLPYKKASESREVTIVQSYQKASKYYTFLNYENYSIKASLLSGALSYVGILGYYNPFTGEAQINNKVPDFLQPFITCHEVAHQLGYAKEAEANFVGYLVASSSDDSLLRYSACLEMFLYANQGLYIKDSAAANSYRNRLSPDVKKDLDEWRKFNLAHQSFYEPVVSWFYDKYLKTRNQPAGVNSYGEVISYMTAYYRKFGTI